MTRPVILLRADASHGLGLGHVARLAALLEEIDPSVAEPIALFGGDPANVRAWLAHGTEHLDNRAPPSAAPSGPSP